MTREEFDRELYDCERQRGEHADLPAVVLCGACGTPVDYAPEYCCNGTDCCCRGLPINQPLCPNCL